jgi:D-sedoheptulose 7-phosphate isomerase
MQPARDALDALARRRPDLVGCIPALEEAFRLLEGSFRRGGTLLVCGNGGSAADGDHIVGELMKGFLLRRPIPAEARRALVAAHPRDGTYLAEALQGALPAIALASHTALVSAIANDMAADMVYAQQVHGYGRPGDVLLAISTSGSARNVVRAVQVASAAGIATIGLTGASGGRLAEHCTVTVRAPFTAAADVQEAHLPIYHCLCAMLEAAFFGDAPGGTVAEAGTGAP